MLHSAKFSPTVILIVNSLFYLSRPALAMTMAALLLAGCGQTGPLYLPVKPAARQQAPADAAPLPPTATPPVPVSR
jgi:predicted small lipoprotein YifL